MLGEVEWVPTASVELRGEGWADLPAVRAYAEASAIALRLPLVWPDRLPSAPSAALRAATYAAEIGLGARFALAASRLAFCGGFDLEDPETLAEAAAAAGVPLRGCIAAAGEHARDETLRRTARSLLARDITALPAIRIGHRWLEGDQALSEAAAMTRAGADVSERRVLGRSRGLGRGERPGLEHGLRRSHAMDPSRTITRLRIVTGDALRADRPLAPAS
jgi:hypothetical protein